MFGKDRWILGRLMAKLEVVIDCDDVNHYKNLRRQLKHLKRAHVGHFVLTFRYIESEDKVVFYDFDHHDKIYR